MSKIRVKLADLIEDLGPSAETDKLKNGWGKITPMGIITIKKDEYLGKIFSCQTAQEATATLAQIIRDLNQKYSGDPSYTVYSEDKIKTFELKSSPQYKNRDKLNTVDKVVNFIYNSQLCTEGNGVVADLDEKTMKHIISELVRLDKIALNMKK